MTKRRKETRFVATSWGDPGNAIYHLADATNSTMLVKAARFDPPIVVEPGQTLTLKLTLTEGNQKGGKGE